MNVAHLFDSGQANLFSPDEGGPGIMGQTCHELTGVWKYPIHWYHWLFNNDYNMTIYIWLMIHYMAIEYPSSSHSMIFNGHIMPCMYPNVSIHWHISLAYWGLNHAKSTILQKPCVRQKETSEAQVPGHVVARKASRPKLMTTFGRTWPGGMPWESDEWSIYRQARTSGKIHGLLHMQNHVETSLQTLSKFI